MELFGIWYRVDRCTCLPGFVGPPASRLPRPKLFHSLVNCVALLEVVGTVGKLHGKLNVVIFGKNC